MQLVAYYVTSFVSRARSERGQDLLEYAMLGGLIAAALIALLTAGILTGAINDMASGIEKCIDFDKTSVCDAGF